MSEYHSEENAAWDELLQLGVSEQTLQIVTSINGYSMQTLEDVLYAYCGNRSFDQLHYEQSVT